ncbi:putative sterile alpha motif domain-containing protein 9-like [Triplophysa rosa]|uniref:Sterile alpha motif domain-containing protein 9-like n=1 Tax=Triplophysa rosa TaxID=992332 RepID=A0A9W7WAP6_TRIRA|nr:putative sterile alpha motif domain-containing protein 9-like [Triplophysa rosa]
MEDPQTWTESMVSDWLRSIGIKETYIKKLHEEEVDGRVLLELSEDFLKNATGMKSGPALLIIKKRDELVKSSQKAQNQQDRFGIKKDDSINEEITDDSESVIKTKGDAKLRPFGTKGDDFKYVENNVLEPESGVIDLITPCHEYKSFKIAATLDRQRLQAKFAKEVLKFATVCVNMRTNDTIHFGVMDSRGDTGYVHGEIVGIPVREKDMYCDALDYIERSFDSCQSERIRPCIGVLQFIQVVCSNSSKEHYVVEVDIEPSVSKVKNNVFSVCLPNFNEKANKVQFEKKTAYRRVGSKSESVVDLNEFYQNMTYRDAQREEAETRYNFTTPELCQNLGKKLIMLITDGKKKMDKDKWIYKTLIFLLNMNVLCVFDFDKDSNMSGLCHEYNKHHVVNRHFMQNYKISSGMTIKDFESHLHLFDQISWIFCNGRSDFKGNEPPCDEKTWVKTKRTLLKDCVSLICKDVLPKGTFKVIFLLTSSVETRFLNTFYEFITDMKGHDDIICLAESEENFKKWQTYAMESCDMDTVNATLQQVQPTTTQASKRLPIHVKGECFLDLREEEVRYSLEILSLNHCEETIGDIIEYEMETTEQQFYQGGKVTWMNLWLAEKKVVGEVIQRDAYSEVNSLLNDCLIWSLDRASISCINIYHHPGSGGSTVARQVLWNNRRALRCAVVKHSYSASVFSEHAVWLREYEEKDPQKCLPVLLLIEDCEQEYLEGAKYELEVAVNTKKIARGTLCFILLSCRRSHNPEKMCKESPHRNVSVTHKLSDAEKDQFSKKRQKLEEQFKPEFILTFVLMCEDFKSHKITEYVKQFVKHLLQGIDQTSVVTKLVQYVALLNTYVQNSFMSLSHCESVLALSIHVDRFRQHSFETALSEQANLVLIHLRDENTYITSIRIIHPLVAKEILHQFMGEKQQQSYLALDLLNNDVLFEHRFGKDQYLKFLRDLFITRCKIIRGDELDSFFSPLIEHVRENECPDKSIELLKEAYKRFNEDALFAQHLARLNYKHDRFEEAEKWAETAVAKRPNNSYILDTKGQVYRQWFTAKCKAMEQIEKTPENTVDAVETALKAIECFQACGKAGVADNETMNNAGFFGVVEVGCVLLKLISSIHVFSRPNHVECIKYLLTDYIPVEIEKPWEHFHCELKKLHKILLEALEWISEDLSYFQTDLNRDEGKTSEKTIKHPIHWLVNKTSDYGKYFINASITTDQSQIRLTPLMKRMMIYSNGGGNITTIFSILTNQKCDDRQSVLEHIISFYPSNPMSAKMPQMDLVKYIASHFALSCLSTQSSKLAAFQDLQKLSNQFPKEKEIDTEKEKERKYEIVLSAVEHLQRCYEKKLKDIPPRKKRIYTHFFLGNGAGFEKIVHKSKVETITKLFSVSEKRQKWFSGEVWKMPEIAKLLRRVPGWTEDEKVFVEIPTEKTFQIPALNPSSVPHSNENVTFYLGFTLKGPVAYNITVRQ